VEGWKGGRVEGWKGGRVEGWKGGRVEGEAGNDLCIHLAKIKSHKLLSLNKKLKGISGLTFMFSTIIDNSAFGFSEGKWFRWMEYRI
jgi:hypothetical protein